MIISLAGQTNDDTAELCSAFFHYPILYKCPKNGNTISASPRRGYPYYNMRKEIAMKKSKKYTLGAKGVAVASVLGVAAIAVAVVSAYNSTMQRLVPTNNDKENSTVSTWVFEVSEPDQPVANNVSDVPMENATEDSEPAIVQPDANEQEQAQEVNKPVYADIGNIMPVTGEISHPFSNGELVKSETLGVWKTHDGCDILCELGTDVRSMSDGVVKEISEDPLWGVTLVVEQSNGYEVHYCGMAKELNVKTGQQVKQGEILGVTSDTCQAEIVQPPHLHLSVKQNGKWIDPQSIVEKDN